MVLISVASALGNFGWGLALGFAMAAAGLLSVAILRFSPERTFRIGMEQRRLRGFKGEDTETLFRIKSPMGMEESAVVLPRVPEGLRADLNRQRDGSWRILANSRFAGMYQGLKVRLSFVDFLGIAERYEERELDLRLEFLPRALLFELPETNMAPVTLGEVPANRMGLAQEFYGAERYNLSQDVKDILWKRLARYGTSSPMVRVREANTPELLTACVLELKERKGLEYYHWMDAVCEAVARLGRAAIGVGMRFRVLRITRVGRTLAEAHDLGSLADCAMAVWGVEEEGKPSEGPESASILVTGEDELNSGEAGLVPGRPTVVISPRPTPGAQNPRSVFFSGSEDLSGLVGLVLSR